jgi:hypothetical protein
METSGQLHAPAILLPRKEPPVSIRGLLGPRAGLESERSLCYGVEISEVYRWMDRGKKWLGRHVRPHVVQVLNKLTRPHINLEEAYNFPENF